MPEDRSTPVNADGRATASTPRGPAAAGADDDGWVPVRHVGGSLIREFFQDEAESGPELPAGDRRTPLGAPPRPRDAQDPLLDREEQPFEREPGPRRTPAAEPPAGGKLETVLHQVERGENFWTISRLYYNSGRYYRALWKANAQIVPRIDELYVGTVIRVPPPEDLDPAFIEPVSAAAAQSPREAARSASGGSRSQDRSDANGVPIRRSNRASLELNLPVADPLAERASEAGPGFRTASRSGSPRLPALDDPGPEVPPLRPEPQSRPLYKVRPYDTLRTIARDLLGDSRRAREILELNRDVIDDPANLVVGQLLELPEDARITRPRDRR